MSPAGTDRDTVCEVSPASSIPTTVTSATSSPALTSRRRLVLVDVRPGVGRRATRCRVPSGGTVSCIAVRKPSVVRTYESTSISRSLVNSSRQSPSPAPVFPVRPLGGVAELQVVRIEVLRLVGSDCKRQRFVLAVGVFECPDRHGARRVGTVHNPGESLASVRVRGRREQRYPVTCRPFRCRARSKGWSGARSDSTANSSRRSPASTPPSGATCLCRRRVNPPARHRRRTPVRPRCRSEMLPAGIVSDTPGSGERPASSSPATEISAGSAPGFDRPQQALLIQVASWIEDRQVVPPALDRPRVVHRRQEAVGRPDVRQHLDV